jgi:hypothetical protein
MIGRWRCAPTLRRNARNGERQIVSFIGAINALLSPDDSIFGLVCDINMLS